MAMLKFNVNCFATFPSLKLLSWKEMICLLEVYLHEVLTTWRVRSRERERKRHQDAEQMVIDRSLFSHWNVSWKGQSEEKPLLLPIGRILELTLLSSFSFMSLVPKLTPCHVYWTMSMISNANFWKFIFLSCSLALACTEWNVQKENKNLWRKNQLMLSLKLSIYFYVLLAVDVWLPLGDTNLSLWPASSLHIHWFIDRGWGHLQILCPKTAHN